MINLKYLNHNFELLEGSNSLYKCIKCNIIAFHNRKIDALIYKYDMDNSEILDIDCESMIIKILLE